MAVSCVSCRDWGCVVNANAVAWARVVRAVGASTDRVLLVRLAELADEKGRGRVSREVLADAVAPRQRMVDGFLGRLERRGLVALHSTTGSDVVVFDLPFEGAS